MRFDVKLTKRETQVAELLAWGAEKKRVAEKLFISVHTVENTARNIYSKLEIQKATELCVWWFCTRFDIPASLSPLRKALVSVLLIALLGVYEYCGYDVVRTSGRQAERVLKVVRNPKRTDGDVDLLIVV
jgi:DNA-binding CsgD family transcriptional regulator